LVVCHLESSVAFAISLFSTISLRELNFRIWGHKTDTKTTTQQLDLVYQMNWILVSSPLSAENSYPPCPAGPG
jgi:hypothetical protein